MTESLHPLTSEEAPAVLATDAPAASAPAPDAPAPDSAAKLEAEIQAALAAPFEVRLREHKGRHSLCIPELGLVVGGRDLSAVHMELAILRERRIREFAAEGLLHLVNKPAEAEAAPAPGTLARLKPFLIKCLMVSVLFLMGVNLLGQRLGDVGYVLEKKLQGLSNWTPEQVEWHRARSEQIAQKLGPTIRELLVMFRDPAAQVMVPGNNPARPVAAPAPEPVPGPIFTSPPAPAPAEAAPAAKPAPEKPAKKRAPKA